MAVDIRTYAQPLFFIGAGMSAESGVPTYRGSGGIWTQYRYQDYACQRAFERDPQAVLRFHQLRRTAVAECRPHAGHLHLARLQHLHPAVTVVTQNIDGLLQAADVRVAAELHGSLWRVRCRCGVREDRNTGAYTRLRCADCGHWVRPDITWFEDMVDEPLFAEVGRLVAVCDLFVAIGTSAVVWPAAGFAELAHRQGAHMIELNPEPTALSGLYARCERAPAALAMPALFPLST